MKKFFTKASKENNLDLQQSFIGKIYTIAGAQYVVEEVIAEGCFFASDYMYLPVIPRKTNWLNNLNYLQFRDISS